MFHRLSVAIHDQCPYLGFRMVSILDLNYSLVLSNALINVDFITSLSYSGATSIQDIRSSNVILRNLTIQPRKMTHID